MVSMKKEDDGETNAWATAAELGEIVFEVLGRGNEWVSDEALDHYVEAGSLERRQHLVGGSLRWQYRLPPRN